MKNTIFNNKFVDNWRYEKKGIINEIHFTQLRNLLRINRINFSKVYPDREVNNIYFDHNNWSNYIDHVIGSAFRQKMRIRWYGNFENALKPKLEFKLKKSNVGNKLKFNINSFRFESKLNSQSLRNIMSTSLNKNNSVFLYSKQFHPRLINTYKRSYFLSEDKKIRITVDRHMKFGRFSSIGDHGKLSSLTKPLCIIEIKYDSETLANEYDLNGLFVNFLQKYSKYLSGIQHVYNLNDF